MSDKADSQADIETIKRRKKEGIDIPIQKNVQAKTTTTYLEFVRLIHNALPEIDYDEIDISTTFLNRLFCCTPCYRFYDWWNTRGIYD